MTQSPATSQAAPNGTAARSWSPELRASSGARSSTGLSSMAP